MAQPMLSERPPRLALGGLFISVIASVLSLRLKDGIADRITRGPLVCDQPDRWRNTGKSTFLRAGSVTAAPTTWIPSAGNRCWESSYGGRPKGQTTSSRYEGRLVMQAARTQGNRRNTGLCALIPHGRERCCALESRGTGLFFRPFNMQLTQTKNRTYEHRTNNRQND